MIFRLIPVFITGSKRGCDDTARFSKKLKLVNAKHYSIPINGKIPKDFNKNDLIVDSHSITELLSAGKKQATMYWNKIRDHHDLAILKYGTVVSIEFEIDRWFLFVYEKSSPPKSLMRFYIEQDLVDTFVKKH